MKIGRRRKYGEKCKTKERREEGKRTEWAVRGIKQTKQNQTCVKVRKTETNRSKVRNAF